MIIIIMILIFIVAIAMSAAAIWATVNGYIEAIFYAISAVAVFAGWIALINQTINPIPTKQDVLDGKAYYQETQVITSNDTIKTYEIVWKNQ